MLTATTGASAPLTSLRKLGFAALLLFLFILNSRVFDIVLTTLHLPSLSLAAALGAAFISGGIMRAFSNRIGAALICLTVWMCMAVPFSVWRGGAANTVYDRWFKSFLIYFIVAALIYTWGHFRRTYFVLAISVLVLAFVALKYGTYVEGRLFLNRGRFGNPNDLAQILLMSLPFWWFIATNPALKPSRRFFAYLATLPIFLTIAMTGSRGALIATTILLAILFLRSPLKQKVQLAAIGGIVLTVAVATLPSVLKERYFTYFKPTDPTGWARSLIMAQVQDDATSSTYARWALLQDSITLTFQNPLFGVGPGMFDVAQDVYSWQTRGRKGAWQVTHNTYTEISSESGIPALILYVLTLVFTWQATRINRPRDAVLSPRQAEMVSAAFALRLSLVVFAVSAMFASFAYQPQMLLLAGLGVALRRSVAMEFNTAEERPRASVARFHPVAHPVLLLQHDRSRRQTA
ncbi:MAG TPA: O-antigen ligase family protein [Bryobacteraceae bacterium]|nr:O-antigen ligase family protein [Bryobacteraceae bacterium]